MNEVVLNILKEKPIIIPKILLRHYKKINITEEELIVLICLIGIGDKVPYNPSIFEHELGMDKFKGMELLNNLSEKGIINIKVENNKSGKKQEYIYLEFLYLKLINIVLDETEETETGNSKNNDIFSLFEQELGRTISSMEIEIIKEWLDSYEEELIKEALKEAIYNDVRNLKYIDKILYNWRLKGIKNKNDVLKSKKSYRKNAKQVEPIYDYNWLEDDSNE